VINPAGSVRFFEQVTTEAREDLKAEGCALAVDGKSDPDGFVTVQLTVRVPPTFAARLNAAFGLPQ
jgi:hypothetical protein